MNISLIEANEDLGVHVDGADLGPGILTSHFKNHTIYKVNKPQVKKEREKENLAKNLDSVNKFDEELYNVVKRVKTDKQFPITIGGDHTIAISSALASISVEKSLGIIWIDAHGDYNTFDTTITGNLHGLPLAATNGLCDRLTSFHKGNFYKSTNTVIIGARDLDLKEKINLKENNVTVFTTTDIKEKGVQKIMQEAFKIANQDTNGIHISYDLDVIDPIIAPGVSVPASDGINEEEAMEITDFLIKNKDKIKSMDLVEYNPTRDKEDKTKNIALNILKKVIANF